MYSVRKDAGRFVLYDNDAPLGLIVRQHEQWGSILLMLQGGVTIPLSANNSDLGACRTLLQSFQISPETPPPNH